jgi:hypothetical protein
MVQCKQVQVWVVMDHTVTMDHGTVYSSIAVAVLVVH